MTKVRFQTLFFIVVAIIFFSDCKQVVCQDAIKCCYDNHIGSCNPGKDDDRCNQMCLKNTCNKGGFCKVFKRPSPNHYCHFYC
jgi:hypothetical protein